MNRRLSSRRSRMRTSSAAVAAAALVVTLAPVVPVLPAAPASAAAGAGFDITVADLKFILKQIQIAEAHATRGGSTLGSVIAPTPLVGPGANDIPDPRLPWGLRQVDGRNNNLMGGSSTWNGRQYTATSGQSAWGAADMPFPRLAPAQWRPAEAVSGFGPTATTYDSAYRPSSVQDVSPRLISNLIADQNPITNPAAAAAGGSATANDVDGSVLIPNTAPNAGVAAPYNGMFALFGQFFDHGLDLVGKTGQEAVVVPLQPDDPLYATANPKFMVASRTILSGDAGVNTTTPWIDQNQTYTSHPSHQVFLREYGCGTPTNTGATVVCSSSTSNRPVASGHLLDGTIAGNIANWGEVKAQAAAKLGIALTDLDILDVPLLLTDEYGRFLRGPNGFPQLVRADGTVVEGNPRTPVSTAGVVKTGHAFLDDIAHDAVPTKAGYNAAKLAAHFITGDGRGNENIGLTAVHTVFHAEHNRVVEDIKTVIAANSGGTATSTRFAYGDWRTSNTSTASWNGERLFQAARFITEMEYQHLVFGEFVRKFQPGIRAFVAYDPTLRPDITAEFAHAVYRFGHSQLNGTIDRISAGGVKTAVPLLDAFLSPQKFNEGGLTGPQAAGTIARGMSQQVGNEIDEFVTNTLRNSLLGLPLDLATLNLVRGRDTGIPSLNAFRAQIYRESGREDLAPYASWADFQLALRHPESIVNFVAAYGRHSTITGSMAARRAAAQALLADPTFMFGEAAVTGLDDVDLWIGGLAEARNMFGGMLGSTFDYVFKRQMEQLQEGDRLYYLARTAGLNLGVQLESNTFSEIIARNTDADTLPADAFAYPALTVNMADATPPTGVSEWANPVTGLAKTWRYSGAKHAVFNGTSGAEGMWGGDGNDTLRGNDGRDWANGGKGDDNLIGGNGDDILVDVGGIDILTGGAGNDYLSSGGPGVDSFFAGSGADMVVGGGDPATVLGGPGGDLVAGGTADDVISGDDGSDWLEGGAAADSITADTIPPFGIDAGTPGDDVVVGGSGDDLLSGGGGLDVSLDGPGTDTFLGDLGFDWTTYYDAASTGAVEADLTNLVPVPGAIIPALQDAFQDVEALSGGDGDDILRGDLRTTLAVVVNGATVGTDALAQADIAKVQGLQTLLGAGSTGLSNGNILTGGRGSDVLEGRGGNDLIDGDAWLVAQLSIPAADATAAGITGTVDPVSGRVLVNRVADLRKAVADGLLNPGAIAVVRRVEPGARGAETDTAVFSGNLADYTISYRTDGTVRVTDGVAGRDGQDTLRGIEAMRFLDQTVTPAVPAPPANVAVSGVSGGLVVTWDAPAGTTATSYTARAFSSLTATSATRTCQPTTLGATGITCTLTSLTNGTTYYVDVIATNGSGNSAPAPNPRLAGVPGTAPAAPTGLLLTPKDRALTASWTAPAGTVTGYTARAFANAGDATPVSTCSTTTTRTCDIAGLVNGTAYVVNVVAINSVGTSVPSADLTATPVGPPGRPQSVQAVAGDRSAVITWLAPSTDGGSPVTGYTVSAYTTVNGTTAFTSCVPTSLSSLTCELTGLTNKTTYSVEVVATNAYGSTPSAPRLSVTPASVPAAPEALVATPTRSPDTTAVTSVMGVTVTWKAPSTGPVPSDYDVTVTDQAGLVTGSCLKTTLLTCTLTGMAKGQPHVATVRARLDGVVGPAATVGFTTLTTVPGAVDAPVVVRAARSGNGASIVASWSAPRDIGGSAVTSYTVTAYDSSGVAQGSWTGLPAPDASGVMTSPQFSAAIRRGSTVYVKVRAANTTGAGAEGTPSATVTVQ